MAEEQGVTEQVLIYTSYAFIYNEVLRAFAKAHKEGRQSAMDLTLKTMEGLEACFPECMKQFDAHYPVENRVSVKPIEEYK